MREQGASEEVQLDDENAGKSDEMAPRTSNRDRKQRPATEIRIEGEVLEKGSK